MKNHERRELVNTLTKIARDYGQTQQLRERIAHALPFDCDVIDAPCVEDARAMGHTGSLADEAERFAFEAWMEGHEWGLGATWDGGPDMSAPKTERWATRTGMMSALECCGQYGATERH